MLTDLEIKRLEHRDPATSKQNDFIVRRKFKKWLNGLYVVSVFIMHYLPSKQLEKIVTHKHVAEMCNILPWSMLAAGAVPITQVNGENMVVLPDHTPRYAEPEEALLRGEIKLLINNLFRLLSSEDIRDVIRTEIGFYQRDYVLAKKEALKEPESFAYFPKNVKEDLKLKEPPQ